MFGNDSNNLHRLVESNVLGVLSWHIDGLILDANEAFADIIGFSQDELRSGTVTWTDLTPPKWHAADAAAIESLHRTGVAQPYEKEFLHRSGRHVRVLIGSAFLSKSTKNGVAFVIDLTERERLAQALQDSETRYRVMVEAADDAILTLDEHNSIMYANAAAEKMFGYRPEDLLNRTIDELIPSAFFKAYRKTLRQHAKSGPHHNFRGRKEVSARHRNGSSMMAEVSLGATRQEGQHLVTAIVRDITERKSAEVLCHQQNRVLEMIARGQPLNEILIALVESIENQRRGLIASILMLDKDGIHIRHGAAPHLPVAYSAAVDGTCIGPKAGSCGTAMYIRKPVIAADILEDPLWEDYRDLAQLSGMRACWSTPIVSSYGSILGSFAMYYSEPRTPDPNEVHLANVASHIAGIAIERKRTEDYISHMAHHDALTGLANRAMLQTRLQQALSSARRRGDQLAVMFIDLDDFKAINDTLGHHVGDHLLKTVSERLKHCLREGDEVARLGGDEFVIVLPSLPHADEAATVARKVLEVLDQPFAADDHEFQVGASIGISVYPTDGDTVEQLMKAADTAMYHAKEQGRGNYKFFTQRLNEAIQHRVRTERQLRHALSRGELALYYQPQIDLQNGRMVGAEALLRWSQTERGMISPEEFIPIAEDTGMILPIGEWSLREACRQLADWHQAGHTELSVAVNLSARQMCEGGIFDDVAAILEEAGLPPQALNLEITESILMRPSDSNLSLLRQFGDLGIHLSVDDFGTGYSNLAFLQEFPIHALKIDRSFVRGIGKDRNNMAITDTIIAMAKALNLDVIAEGVETEEQATFLREHGCGSAQGFYFGKPMVADMLDARIEQRGEW